MTTVRIPEGRRTPFPWRRVLLIGGWALPFLIIVVGALGWYFWECRNDNADLAAEIVNLQALIADLNAEKTALIQQNAETVVALEQQNAETVAALIQQNAETVAALEQQIAARSAELVDCQNEVKSLVQRADRLESELDACLIELNQPRRLQTVLPDLLRDNTTLIYVVDDSGSMVGNITKVREALQEMQEKPAVNARVSIVLFGDSYTTLFNFTALAAVEACFRYQRAVGSLAEIVSTFIINRSRWISVEHTKIPIPNRNALAQNGRRPAAADPGKARAKQAQKIKARIFDLALPENRYDKSAFLTPGTRESEQRIYVTMPLERDEVREIRDDIEDQLKREEFCKAFPRTHIAYADGNPHPPNPQNLEYIHIVKFVGLAAEPRPVSLTSILDNEPLPDDPRRLRHYDVKTRGQQIVENGHILGKPATDSAADGDAAPATRSNGNTPSDAASPTPII